MGLGPPLSLAGLTRGLEEVELLGQVLGNKIASKLRMTVPCTMGLFFFFWSWKLDSFYENNNTQSHQYNKKQSLGTVIISPHARKIMFYRCKRSIRKLQQDFLTTSENMLSSKNLSYSSDHRPISQVNPWTEWKAELLIQSYSLHCISCSLSLSRLWLCWTFT